jgi:cellobiose-specific phosphotransferase system component IIC
VKKILWKSDLWVGTVTFGVMTLCCLAYLALHLARGETGEAFAMGIVAAIPATITLFCAFTDRNEAKAVWVHPQVEEDMLERSGVIEASCLNPENPVNAERIRRGKDKTRPPDIG